MIKNIGTKHELSLNRNRGILREVFLIPQRSRQTCRFVKSHEFTQFVSGCGDVGRAPWRVVLRNTPTLQINISGGPLMFCSPKTPVWPPPPGRRISQVTGQRRNKAPRLRAGHLRLTSALNYLHLIMNVTQRLAESLPMHAGGRRPGRAGPGRHNSPPNKRGWRAAAAPRHAIRRVVRPTRLW